MEYVYILKNQSYLPYVLKIGRTKNSPVIRAKQIYWNATGVPEHFELVYVCQVPDCVVAEDAIHKVLSSYRKNGSREFFHIPLKVAKNALWSVCENLFGSAAVEVVIDEEVSGADVKKESSVKRHLKKEGGGRLVSCSIDEISESPIGTSVIDDGQKARIAVINEVLKEVFPISLDEMGESFSRDKEPEREIKVWEHMAKAYMKVATDELLSYEFKKEAYHLLLFRSMEYKSEVLKRIKGKVISRRVAKKILDAYELKPKPLSVRRGEVIITEFTGS
ncbi:GIY-YIG nuclease family protein [Salinicola acroporae]|uniref:GIY-YIG nuclease family protein n=1 Tax=Salinicola acroporae TaxID=1541440 RepID=UPI00245521CE